MNAPSPADTSSPPSRLLPLVQQVRNTRHWLLPLLAAWLWVWFLWLDLSRIGDSTGVKFAGILLCLLYAWVGCSDLDGLLMALALSLTVGADWFLLVRNDHYVQGIVLFCLVQLLYALRLLRARRSLCRGGLLLRAGAALMTGAGLLARRRLGALLPGLALGQSLLALFYFTCLCCNAMEATLLLRQNSPSSRHRRAFALGLGLFVCCDLCVGAWNLGLFQGFSRVGMWLFYLPSQVLLVLSHPLKGEF